MSLIVIGGTVIDVIFTRAPRLPCWPRHGEFTASNLVLLGNAPLVTLGGNGANAAFVAARCGAAVRLFSNLGPDDFGGLARRWLESAGCRISSLGAQARTAVNVTAANARHARATFYYPGEVPAFPSSAKARAVATHALVCGWPHPPLEETARHLRGFHRAGIFTALDPGPFLTKAWRLDQLNEVWPSLRLLVLNEHELLTLTRCRELAAALKKIRRRFQGHLVVKRGRLGAVHLHEGSSKLRRVAPVKVRTVNTIGAGDSFNGALLAALSRGKEFPAALAAAAKTAAQVVASNRGVLGLP